jgi:hypothetical protein
MKMEVTFTFTEAGGDGYNGVSSFSREDLTNLTEASQLLRDAFRGAGFSYVSDVGFEQDDGRVVFGNSF